MGGRDSSIRLAPLMTKPLAGQAAAMRKSKVRLKCRSAVRTMMMLEPIRGPPETHSLHTHDSTTDSTLDCACHLGSSIASCSTATQRTAIPPSLASPKSPVPAPPDSRQADPFDRTCHTAPYTLARYAEELPTLRPARVQGESRHAGSANAGVQLKGRSM